MSFIRADTIVLNGTITYQERCRGELSNASLARSSLHFVSLQKDNDFSLPPSANLQARSFTNQEPKPKSILSSSKMR